MKRISTHVLDTTRGIPAAGLSIRLEKQDTSGGWRVLTSTRTDQDGRCSELLPDAELLPGIYRLRFDTANYFSALKIERISSAEAAVPSRSNPGHMEVGDCRGKFASPWDLSTKHPSHLRQ